MRRFVEWNVIARREKRLCRSTSLFERFGVIGLSVERVGAEINHMKQKRFR